VELNFIQLLICANKTLSLVSHQTSLSSSITRARIFRDKLKKKKKKKRKKKRRRKRRERELSCTVLLKLLIKKMPFYEGKSSYHSIETTT